MSVAIVFCIADALVIKVIKFSFFIKYCKLCNIIKWHCDLKYKQTYKQTYEQTYEQT
jgi:hypothetical protein